MAYGRDLKYYESLGPDHPVLLKRPEIRDDAAYWYETFHQLTTSRPASMGGALPIPITEIEAYCRMAQVPEPDRWDFLRIVRHIDLAFLNAMEQRKAITLPQPKG